MNKVRAGISALSITHPQLKQTLSSILNSVPQTIWQKVNELELVRINLEGWFNNAMDRLSGWYKRRSLGVTLRGGNPAGCDCSTWIPSTWSPACGRNPTSAWRSLKKWRQS